jgi:hypothetical protein
MTRKVFFLATALASRVALADDWKLELEAGSGYDSNCHRQSGPGAEGALLGQAGARFAGGTHAGDTFRFSGAGLALGRGYAGDDPGSENVLVLQGDVRADAVLGELAPGIRASYFDAIGSYDTMLAFRTGEADAELTLRHGGHRVEAFGGWRFFHYKPHPELDFAGARIGLQYGYTFPGEEEVWAFRAGYSLNHRAYSTMSMANICAPGEPLLPGCLVPTGDDRVDLFHDASLELSYTGAVLASARYHLMVNDSSSFAQSLIRHRLELAATFETWLEVVLTVKVLLQVNGYPDGLILEGDLGTFTTIEDETRNALIFHLTREITKGWMVEARYAFYFSPFAPAVSSYTRHALYVGAVVSFGDR